MIFHVPKTIDDSDNSVMPECSSFGSITNVTLADVDFGSSTQVVDVSVIDQTPWYASNRSDVPSKDDLIKLSDTAYLFLHKGLKNEVAWCCL